MKKLLIAAMSLLPAFSHAQSWFSGTDAVYTNGKVGIGGISAPSQALEVNGNSIFNGSISATSMNVGQVYQSGKMLKVNSSFCFKGYDSTVAGSRNELCGLGHDFYFQSTSGLNYNSIFNYSNGGMFGIGTNAPIAKLHVQGSTYLDGDLSITGRSRFYRIAALAGDSIIRFGDSTIHMNTTTNTIYGSGISSPFTVNKGLGLGSYTANGKGLYTVAIGWQSQATKDYSISMGHFVNSNGIQAITIGSGFGSGATPYLINNTDNSLMIGFNSNLPSMFVAPSAGVGKVGFVGFGTAAPNTLVHIRNVNPQLANGYTLKVEDVSNSNGVVISSGNSDDAAGGDIGVILLCKTNDNRDILRVRSSGITYAREIKVNLDAAWPDYVFGGSYKPMGLAAIESYYKTYHHLPEVPSADEIKKDGINLGEMDAVLLKKIEELTLYMVELKKENEQMKAEIEQLKNR